jgi:outer membrane protein TolC
MRRVTVISPKRRSTSRSSRSSIRSKLARKLFALGSALVVAVGGCSREYYRHQADDQAKCLIREKQNDPRWDIPDRSVYIDPHSRYHDPNDPDHEPLPPDDPKSHELMHCVYGMKGYQRWHENGELNELENPGWRQYLTEYMPRDEDGAYQIDLDAALQLALLHSRNYQTNVESLYLSALDVAFERFRFDTQFFAGTRSIWTHLGSEPTQLSSSTLTTVNSARATKLLPAGGQFLIDFANTFVWQFAGSDTNTRADSLLSFTFLQPFLRQGGREVAMERLTLAERGLLANVRQMERYRQGFLLDIAVGTGPVGGPSRQGGFQGEAGLSGFTGTGAGGFAGVGEASNFGRIGAGGGGGGTAGGGGGAGFAAGVAGNVGGFIGLAQRQQQIRNREANLALQLENLARMEELFAAGRIGSFQVDQFRQNVQTTRSQYLAALNDYAAFQEQYLMTALGLPPDIPIRVNQSIVEQFQFTDPTLSDLRARVNLLTDRIRTAEDPSVQALREAFSEFDALNEPILRRFEAVRQDFIKLDATKEERLDALSREKDRTEFLEQIDRLADQLNSLERQYATIRGDLQRTRSELDADQRKLAHQQLVSELESISDLLLELGFNQAGVRLEAIVLPPVKLDSDQALQIARANRLDIMNQRAEVVDQWRLIALNADRLQADLNVELNGSIGTLDRNIVRFRDQTGSFSASVRFDTPITRLGERNLYRQSLIDYQRVRRGYIQFEDQVHQSLRNTLRGVKLFEEEIELRRQAMRIAIRQMDFNQARLKEPPRVGAAGAAAGDPVRDLLGAFSDFLETQNGVMNTYLTYQASRMILYRDLGIVRFDDGGRWIDEPLEAALRRAQSQDDCLPPAYPVLASRNADLCTIPDVSAESSGTVNINLSQCVDDPQTAAGVQAPPHGRSSSD